MTRCPCLDNCTPAAGDVVRAVVRIHPFDPGDLGWVTLARRGASYRIRWGSGLEAAWLLPSEMEPEAGHVPGCAAAPGVPQEPGSGPGLADVAREVGALEERIQRELDAARAAHDAGLDERIAAELARAWRDEGERRATVRAGNVVPDEGMRGRAWRRP